MLIGRENVKISNVVLVCGLGRDWEREGMGDYMVIVIVNVNWVFIICKIVSYLSYFDLFYFDNWFSRV